jgi:hypothetical protein
VALPGTYAEFSCSAVELVERVSMMFGDELYANCMPVTGTLNFTVMNGVVVLMYGPPRSPGIVRSTGLESLLLVPAVIPTTVGGVKSVNCTLELALHPLLSQARTR